MNLQKIFNWSIGIIACIVIESLYVFFLTGNLYILNSSFLNRNEHIISKIQILFLCFTYMAAALWLIITSYHLHDGIYGFLCSKKANKILQRIGIYVSRQKDDYLVNDRLIKTFIVYHKRIPEHSKKISVFFHITYTEQLILLFALLLFTPATFIVFALIYNRIIDLVKRKESEKILMELYKKDILDWWHVARDHRLFFETIFNFKGSDRELAVVFLNHNFIISKNIRDMVCSEFNVSSSEIKPYKDAILLSNGGYSVGYQTGTIYKSVFY